MAKLSLLELTQSILNDMDSDSVNDIDDTTEAQQVASIIKDTYFKLVSSRDDWPFLRTLTTLTGLADVDNPTKMQIPESLNKIYWIRYNRKPVTYLSPEDFKKLVDEREETDDGVVDANGYITNRDPLYWTTYDDAYVWFDSYDSASESTLQSSNCSVYGIQVPSWNVDASFTPTLPEKMFPTLLADAKATAFLALKQQSNPREEAYATRGRIRAQNSAYRADKAEPTYNSNVNYGRR